MSNTNQNIAPAERSGNSPLVFISANIWSIAIGMILCEVVSILPEVTAYFAMEAHVASWLMSVFTLIGIALTLPAGSIATRFKPKTLVLFSGCVAMLGSILVAIAPSTSILMAGRVIQGISFVFVTICGPIIIKDSVKPAFFGIAMSIYGIGFNIATVLAGVLTPTLSEAVGFRVPWLLYGALALVSAVLAYLFMGRLKGGSPGQAQGGTINPPSGSSAPEDQLIGSAVERDSLSDAGVATEGASLAATTKPTFRQTLTKDSVLFMFVALVFNMLSFSILSYVPSVLQIQGYDASYSGFISTLPMLISIASAPVIGLIYDRIGHLKAMLLVFTILLGPFTFAMLNFTGTPLLVTAVLFGLTGMGAPGLILAGFMLMYDRPEILPLAMGIFMLAQRVGQFFGTLITQALLGPSLENWFFTGVILLVCGLLATVALFFARYQRGFKPKQGFVIQRSWLSKALRTGSIPRTSSFSTSQH